MATGSSTDGGTIGPDRWPSVREAGRAVLSALVAAPGRSAAVTLVAVPYVWLGYYVVGTVTGRHGDVIVGGDWLTLVFTSYAFLSALALAHRILRIGVDGLTVESLLDVVVLVWLTAFYFVWMLTRGPVSEATTVAELYEPLLAGDPNAVLWAATTVAIGALAAGIVAFPRPGSRPFRTRFRTALVTLPGVVTAAIVLFRPGVDSLLWPAVIGVFLGTLVAGATRIHVIATAVAKGTFAALSLCVWAVGALGWLAVYRRRPPTGAVVLGDEPRNPADRDSGKEERREDRR